MAKVLITGSQGTIGRRLAERLKEAGHEVWGTDRGHAHTCNYVRADISCLRQLERVFSQQYEYVYHLAAEFGRKNGEDYYEDLWRTNVIGTRNLLEMQVRNPFQMIFASSSEIYGDTHAELLSEDLPLITPILQKNDYALSKWVNEVQIINFEQRHQVPVMRLRLFNAYGPGEFFHPYRSVVCLFVYSALFGLPYTVYQGYHRVFMYIDDLLDTLTKCLDRFCAGQVFNVGGLEYRSVEELSQLVLQYTGADPSLVKYLEHDEHNTLNKRPDVSRAVQTLGHAPRVGLEEGIPLTVEWMKRVYGGGES